MPQRLLAHRNLVQLVQVLACQRWSESPVHRAGKDGDGSLFHLGWKLPIGFSSAQLMDSRLVSFPPHLPQESSHLPLRDADLLGSLLLRDQFLLGLLEGIQPVSLGLGHQQLSFVHPPGWTLSIGHFYFAQIGHYYFAATWAKSTGERGRGTGYLGRDELSRLRTNGLESFRHQFWGVGDWR